jgi:hypothetical protein
MLLPKDIIIAADHRTVQIIPPIRALERLINYEYGDSHVNLACLCTPVTDMSSPPHRWWPCKWKAREVAVVSAAASVANSGAAPGAAMQAPVLTLGLELESTPRAMPVAMPGQGPVLGSEEALEATGDSGNKTSLLALQCICIR